MVLSRIVIVKIKMSGKDHLIDSPLADWLGSYNDNIPRVIPSKIDEIKSTTAGRLKIPLFQDENEEEWLSRAIEIIMADTPQSWCGFEWPTNLDYMKNTRNVPTRIIHQLEDSIVEGMSRKEVNSCSILCFWCLRTTQLQE